MGGIGVLALVANLASVLLPLRNKDGDAMYATPLLVEPDTRISFVRLSDEHYTCIHDTSCPSLLKRTSPKFP